MAIRGLLQLVLLIALALAPICGMGGHAMAMPMLDSTQVADHGGSADAGHCADMGGQEDDDSDRGSDAECRMMGGAGVLTPTPPLAESSFAASGPQGMPMSVAVPGLNPAAEPRPPRFS